jgi:hypothetical protein
MNISSNIVVTPEASSLAPSDMNVELNCYASGKNASSFCILFGQ